MIHIDAMILILSSPEEVVLEFMLDDDLKGMVNLNESGIPTGISSELNRFGDKLVYLRLEEDLANLLLGKDLKSIQVIETCLMDPGNPMSLYDTIRSNPEALAIYREHQPFKDIGVFA